VIVADVSGKNPNVNYELGLAHAFGKPAVIISQRAEDVPFDYRHLRVIIYDTTRVRWDSELASKVSKTIRLVRQNPTNARLWDAAPESTASASQEPEFQFSQGDRPSWGWARTPNQLVRVEARAGSIGGYMFEVIKEVLADVEDHSSEISVLEYLMLRKVWFDDKYGGVNITVELLHDTSVSPSFSPEDLERMFHDGLGWYGAQMTSVQSKVTKTWVFSDGFFPIADVYYVD